MYTNVRFNFVHYQLVALGRNNGEPQVENIDHSRTKARHPQTNGICERFHRTIQEEFYATAFRKKLYHSLDELQADLNEWLQEYNLTRTGAREDARLFFQRSAGAEPCAAERRRRRGR